MIFLQVLLRANVVNWRTISAARPVLVLNSTLMDNHKAKF